MTATPDQLAFATQNRRLPKPHRMSQARLERCSRKFLRLIVTTTMLAGVAVGFAGASSADDLSGTYIVSWSDKTRPTQWTFTPCGPGCSHVTGNTGWTTDAQLINGRWVMGPISHTSICDDGSTESDTANGSFDAATLTGSSVITYPVACRENPPGGVTIQFRLTKTNG